MSLEDRIAQLEARTQLLQDRMEIYDLIASYGPLVDAGDAAATAALWTEEGTYDVDTGRYEGHEGIAAMVGSRAHQWLITRGCAHLTGPPRIELAGDVAVAVCHSQLVVRREDGSGFDVFRATAHHLELVRTPDGWRIRRRTSRLLDGGEDARALFRPDPARHGSPPATGGS
jgi:ketosteroid isomerase-like protein